MILKKITPIKSHVTPSGSFTPRQRSNCSPNCKFSFPQNDSSVVNVTVEDVNEWEPRFRYPHYEFYVGGHPNELIGRIEAADGDRNDELILTLSGENASMFFITPTGELRLRESKGKWPKCKKYGFTPIFCPRSDKVK